MGRKKLLVFVECDTLSTWNTRREVWDPINRLNVSICCRNCLPFWSFWVHPRFLVGFVFIYFYMYVLLIVICSFCSFSFGHCVVCSSSIYGFWLPIWYSSCTCPKPGMNWICNFVCHGLFICSMHWSERWMYVLLILVVL